MLISRDQEIAGLPAVRARELMRFIRDYPASAEEIAELLGADPSEATLVIERLHRHGLICHVDNADRQGTPSEEHASRDGGLGHATQLWRTTIAGNALSKARVGKPMRREVAQGLLDGVIARAAAINADADCVFTVERIEVFGSFADPDRDPVGDVDIHLLFDRRVDGDQFVKEALKAARNAEAAGRRFATHIDRLTFLELEFQRHVRGGSPRLDIQFDAVGHDDPLPDGVTTRVVYERPRPGGSTNTAS